MGDGAEEPGEKLVRPETTIETENKFVKIALQMLFPQAMVGPKEECLYIGDQSMDPVQSTIAFTRNLEQMHVFLTESGPKSIKRIAVDLTARENDALCGSGH